MRVCVAAGERDTWRESGPKRGLPCARPENDFQVIGSEIDLIGTLQVGSVHRLCTDRSRIGASVSLTR